MEEEVDVLRRAYAEKSVECETLRQECYQYVELLRKKSSKNRPRSKRIQVNMNIRFGKSVGVQTSEMKTLKTDRAKEWNGLVCEKYANTNNECSEKGISRSASFVNLVRNWEKQSIKPKLSSSFRLSELRSTEQEMEEKDYKRKFRDLMNDWQRAIVNGETMNQET